MFAENIFDTSLTYHVEFLQFCFIGILQEELDETRRLWNNHFKRKSRNAECPGGRPDVLFHTPFSCGRKRLQITFCLGRCEFGFTILWITSTFWQLWRHCGLCSTYHEWNEYYNAKNSISSKRAFYNSTSKILFSLKSFFGQSWIWEPSNI